MVEIDYFADPAKDAAWAAATRMGLLNEQQFRREFKRDWVTAKGKAFYPEYQLHRTKYVRVMPELINAPVYRGWDFGFNKPGCLWMQYSPSERRLWCLREMLPSDIDTNSFAILIKYLSGDVGRDTLAKWPKAAYWVNHLERQHERAKPHEKHKHPRPPFFPPGTHYIDYSGPECLKTSPQVEGETKERTDFDILTTHGIFLNHYSSRLKAREELIRSLLHIYDDGYPGLLMDPACFHLDNGMAGGIAYPDKGTPSNPQPDDPRKDGHYDHLHDCLGYTVVNIVPAKMLNLPSYASEAISMGLKENEDPLWE